MNYVLKEILHSCIVLLKVPHTSSISSSNKPTNSTSGEREFNSIPENLFEKTKVF